MTIQRPEGFENECKDCTVRAMSLVANIPYSIVHSAFEKSGRKNKHGFHMKSGGIHKVCKVLGIEAKQVKRHGSLIGFINKFPKGRYLCVKRGHAFAVIDGVVHDEDKMHSQIKGAWLITNHNNCKEVSEKMETEQDKFEREERGLSKEQFQKFKKVQEILEQVSVYLKGKEIPKNENGYLDTQKFSELPEIKNVIKQLQEVGIQNSSELGDLGFVPACLIIRFGFEEGD